MLPNIMDATRCPYDYSELFEGDGGCQLKHNSQLVARLLCKTQAENEPTFPIFEWRKATSALSVKFLIYLFCFKSVQ